ncbi:hypothetical protein MRB53_023985 [Persea americana]|uniref:Uncharacterized protein n=1 Tax=Persea americana TaxID=3435 RepID=A0ACC2LC47_PERAE|nr:hypothetical protein MRB53_023985 [Persea americana]
MSCNGCRVLRKGCSDTCSIRPCLDWIQNPESQANATLFLAKFYGRAGLMNLLSAGPENLRPAVFRSLLYEACGRIVNPIYGSVGLLWSGSWQLCQAAVEAVLDGKPIVQAITDFAPVTGPPAKAYDIRHVSKEENSVTQELHRVTTRGLFKKPNSRLDSAADWFSKPGERNGRGPSHDSSLTHQTESRSSVEAALVGRAQSSSQADAELELRLGIGSVSKEGPVHAMGHVAKPGDVDQWDAYTCNAELGLQLSGI